MAYRPARKAVRTAGWDIPGQRLFGKAVWSTRTATMDGVPVLVSKLDKVPVRDGGGYSTSRVFFTFTNGDDVVIKEEQLVASHITRYSSVQGKSFLYTMDGYPCYEVRVGVKASGGCAGADRFLAYYDMDGDIVFETMETPSGIIGTGRDWSPAKPDWVK